MKKAQFTIGVDVSRNTLDIYCIEIRRHVTIENGTIGFKGFQSFCNTHGIDLSQAIVVLEYTGGYEYKWVQYLPRKRHCFCSHIWLGH